MAKSKTTTFASAAPTAAILVAVGELQGGGQTIPAGGELTPEMQEAMGLDDATIDGLVERGHLVPTQARVAQGGDDGVALAAATERAEAAEAKVIELQKQIDDAATAKA